ncbi:MAG: hypothetical protein ACRENZ_03925 [Thermodesulfobacteriota bacterium]
MKRFSLLLLLVLITGVASVIYSTVPTYAAGEDVIVQGNVICLVYDKKGNVTPMIATGPCDGYPPHQHILVTKEGTVYNLQGLEDGLVKIAKMPQRTDVQVKGKVQGNQYGWILVVD